MTQIPCLQQNSKPKKYNMRAVPTWVDKVHDRDRNEQVIMYLIYFAMHSAGGRSKKLGVQTIVMNTLILFYKQHMIKKV